MRTNTKALQHRVVVMKQLPGGSEQREKTHPWMNPSAAEYLSDKEAERVAEDPLRYVLIESNEKEDPLTACTWSPYAPLV